MFTIYMVWRPNTSALQQLALCLNRQVCKLSMAPRMCRQPNKVPQRDAKMTVSRFCLLFESWKMQGEKKSWFKVSCAQRTINSYTIHIYRNVSKAEPCKNKYFQEHILVQWTFLMAKFPSCTCSVGPFSFFRGQKQDKVTPSVMTASLEEMHKKLKMHN